MPEYIKRDDALRELEKINPVDYGAMWNYDAHHHVGECLRDCKEAIDSIPAADVSPVVHGHWIWKRKFRGGVKAYEGEDEFGVKRRIAVDERRWVDEPYCSVCGKLSTADVLNGCPNCCAKMDGGDDNAPTVDAAIVKHGRWLEAPWLVYGAKQYVCSQCKDDEYWKKRELHFKELYCPNCGAQMDLDKQGENQNE